MVIAIEHENMQNKNKTFFEPASQPGVRKCSANLQLQHSALCCYLWNQCIEIAELYRASRQRPQVRISRLWLSTSSSDSMYDSLLIHMYTLAFKTIIHKQNIKWNEIINRKINVLHKMKLINKKNNIYY